MSFGNRFRVRRKCVAFSIWMGILLLSSAVAFSQIKVKREIEFNNKLKDLIHKGYSQIDHGRRDIRSRNMTYGKRLSQPLSKNTLVENKKEYIQQAENMLFKAVSNYERAQEHFSSKLVRPNHFSFGIIINGWAKVGDSSRAEMVLRRMEDLYNSGSWNWLKPDVVKYTNVIKSYARSCNTRNTKDQNNHIVSKVEALVKNMEMSSDPFIHPNTLTYSVVIDLYAKLGFAQKSLELLDRMEQMCNDGHTNVCPNEITYNTCLNAYAKSNEPNAPQIAESILSRMEMLCKKGDENMRPSLISYSTVMNAYARRGYPHHVEYILNAMTERYTKGETSERPDIVMFNTAIAAWSKSKNADAPLRAEKLLKTVMDDDYLKPNTVTFNSVIMVWARHDIGGPVAIDRAENILTQMEEQFERTGDDDVRPDARTYTTIIDALAKSKRPGAARKAEAILRRMKRAYESGNHLAKPSRFTYSGLINAWAKSGEPGATKRAESLLREADRLSSSGGEADLKPFAQTYDALIDCYARSNAQNSVESAESIFKEMLERHLSGDPDMEPSVRTFNKLLLAYANCPNESMVQRAEAFIGNWTRLRRDGTVVAKPNAVTFSTLIKIWGSSKRGGSGAEGAEKVLRYMRDRSIAGDLEMKPDRVAYNSVIGAWAHCKKEEVLDRVLLLYEDMKQQYIAGDISMKPDDITYKYFIKALANSNGDVDEVAAKADILLEHIETDCKSTSVSPDINSCEIVIDMLSRSNCESKEKAIMQIMAYMKKK